MVRGGTPSTGGYTENLVFDKTFAEIIQAINGGLAIALIYENRLYTGINIVVDNNEIYMIEFSNINVSAGVDSLTAHFIQLLDDGTSTYTVSDVSLQ